jgi:integrase
MAFIRKTPSGTWKVGWRDPGGTQRYKSFKTKRAASAYCADLESALHKGLYVDPHAGRRLFGPYAEDWFAARHDERTTTARNESAMRVHVLPRWGSVPMNKIDHLSVQRWVTDLGARRSPATVAKAFMMLSGVLRTAVRDRLIVVSPCEGVQLPRARRKDSDNQVIARHAFRHALLPAVPARYRALVGLGGGAGLRWGEAIGLRWDVIDLEAAEVHIVRTATEVAGHVEVKAFPKSRAGRRAVPLPPFLVELLRAHREQVRPDALGTVFTNTAGGPLRRGLFRTRIWRPALVRAGLLGKVVAKDEYRFVAVWSDAGGLELRVEFTTEREAVEHVARHAGAGLRFHDLRHSYATWLAEDGVPINYAQQVIGHEKASTLLDIYTHTTKNRARANRRILEAFASDPLPADDDPDGDDQSESDTHPPDLPVRVVGAEGLEPPTSAL